MRLLAALWALRSSATGAPTNGTNDTDGTDAAGAGAARLWMTRHYSRPASHPSARAYGASGQTGGEFAIMVTGDGNDRRHARLAGPGLVYVRAEPRELDAFVDLVQPFIAHPYVLVTAGSDQTLPYQRDRRSEPYDASLVARIRAIASDPYLVAWFAENLDEVFAAMVRPFPLGFHKRSHAELWAARAAWRAPRRPRRVVAAARVHTRNAQWEDRRRMKLAADARGWDTANVPFHDWLRVLGNSTHVVCAHGGGWDPNPRLFEALWMGALPIAKRHPATQLALRRFPVLWVDDWDELATLDLDAHADLARAARDVDVRLFTEAFWLDEMRRPLAHGYCPREAPEDALSRTLRRALAEGHEGMCMLRPARRRPARSRTRRAPRGRRQEYCPRPTADALLQAWQDALADLPADMSERPREKRRARRTPNKRRQDICPLETPYDALLNAWRDALAQKVPGGVCKHPRPKSAARLAQETIHRKFGRADLTDKRRHADRVAAKANLHARGARIRREATGGR